MTGVEFLERAMDVVPDAKRVLLTAYADTDAAIRAINDVDLDHYLLKPWDPPEEKLYPVLDELLDDWAARARPAFEGITLLDTSGRPRPRRPRSSWPRNQVPFRHLDVRGEQAKRLAHDRAARRPRAAAPADPHAGRRGAPAARRLRQLAEQVGLSTSAGSRSTTWWSSGRAGRPRSRCLRRQRGLHTLLVEQSATGGQAGQSSGSRTTSASPTACPAPSSPSGPGTRRSASASRCSPPPRWWASSRAATDGSVRFGDGTEVTALAVVLATGVDYSRLPAEGADDFTGRGLFYGACRARGRQLQGPGRARRGCGQLRRPGGALLRQYASKVVMLVRGPDLRRSMSEYLVAGSRTTTRSRYASARRSSRPRATAISSG
jgi:thioredoxin reductase (NADPH)